MDHRKAAMVRELRSTAEGAQWTVEASNAVPWQLHAIEQSNGRWQCASGSTVCDEHDRLSDAIEHLRDLGRTLPSR